MSEFFKSHDEESFPIAMNQTRLKIGFQFEKSEIYAEYFRQKMVRKPNLKYCILRLLYVNKPNNKYRQKN